MAIEKVKESLTRIDTLDSIPTTLPVLPLRDVVIFPYMIFPVLVGRESSLRAANFALENDKYIFLAAQQDPSIDEPGADDIYKEGVVAKIIQILKLPNGLLKILVDGTVQATITKFLTNEKYLQAEIQIHVDVPEENTEMDAIIRHASTLFTEYVRANRAIPPEVLSAYENIKDAQRRLYYIAA
ncbi:MAG TPA: LON peptidase substrate-binding domain-containing protein, partial [Bacteroidota bacterium]|nr:LON peptidase substrate-binding domain-containing protein [Bacteroidota bacterium]